MEVIFYYVMLSGFRLILNLHKLTQSIILSFAQKHIHMLSEVAQLSPFASLLMDFGGEVVVHSLQILLILHLLLIAHLRMLHLQSASWIIDQLIILLIKFYPEAFEDVLGWSFT